MVSCIKRALSGRVCYNGECIASLVWHWLRCSQNIFVPQLRNLILDENTSFEFSKDYYLKSQVRFCVCRKCDQSFIFTPQQQKEFMTQGFGVPSRCPECHERRSARRLARQKGETVLNATVCAECGKPASVPFKPSNAKPVYCSECFRNRKPGADAPAPAPEIVVETVQPVESIPFGGFNLDSRLERAVTYAGYDPPTAVQSAAIPIALSGRDLIAAAQTGTGKTAAFVLPILHNLISGPKTKPCTRVLILTPTRELAEQITQTIRQLSRYTKVKAAAVYGGVSMMPQQRALRDGTDIIVACPGRLQDHMERGNTNLNGVDMVVLDEADRMLDMGFLPAVNRILGFLPKKRQTMLFSATFAPELNKLVENTLQNPERLEVDNSAPPSTIAHVMYPCPQHLKTPLLLALLAQTDTNSVLIFTRTKHRANDLAEEIERAGHSTTALHSNKSQSQRQRALDDFRSGRCQILVATDIAARGLDINTISHVVNYDIPDCSEAYIHRIGRTGRAEREGDALTLVAPQDHGIVWSIEKALGGPIERRNLADFDYKAGGPQKEKPRRNAPWQQMPQPSMPPRTHRSNKERAHSI